MYLPPSVILPEIFYTYGGEYYYPTTPSFYVGYYHKDKYGNAYTGKTHTNDSQKLNPAFTTSLPVENLGTNTLANTYSNLDLSSQNYFSMALPSNDSLPPTSEEYVQTYYTRYILDYKLSSQLYIIETNKSTFFEYLNNTNFSKYFGFAEVLWKISGPLYDVKENGVLMQGGVIDSNLRSINEARKLIPGIENYLVDLTLYYKP